MKDGCINFSKYNITPDKNCDILDEKDFNIVKCGEDIVYISKEPQDIKGMKFWVTCVCVNNIIKKIELNNASEKYKMNYGSMKSNLVQELKNQYDEFLIKNLGQPNSKSIASMEYDYSWGKIVSYYDNKSVESGIIIVYF